MRISRIKRAFHLVPEANEVLERLLATQSANSESAALSAILYRFDEWLQAGMDDRGVRDYLRGRLTREGLVAACRRRQRAGPGARYARVEAP